MLTVIVYIRHIAPTLGIRDSISRREWFQSVGLGAVILEPKFSSTVQQNHCVGMVVRDADIFIGSIPII